MPVFKLGLQILNKNKIAILAAFVIAIALSFVFVQTSDNTTTIKKQSIAIIDNDQSEASKALRTSLALNNNIVALEESDIEDALFYRDVTYVLYISKGYQENIKEFKDIELEKKEVSGAMSGYLVDQQVKDFNNTLQLQYKYQTEKNLETAIQLTKENLAVKIQSETAQQEKKSSINSYFNFLSYSFVSGMILSVGYLQLTCNKTMIKRRNAVAPLSSKSITLQTLLAALTIGVALLVITSIFAYTIFAKQMQDTGSYLYIVNLATWLFVTTSLAYLVTSFTKKMEVLGGINTMVSLSLAFLGGSFVPQAVMGEAILKVSMFLPSFWNVKTNNMIQALGSTSAEALKPIVEGIGIQLAFGVIFLVLVFIKQYYGRKNITV